MDIALDKEMAALVAGRAFVRPRARTVAVRGADAERWLNDLVTAGVQGLRTGDAVRSLILTPTGRIRADVHVLRTIDGFRLVQPLDQPEPVHAILSPYVLSSKVEIDAKTEASPLLVPEGAGWRATFDAPAGAVEVTEAAAERWRIASGFARFPVDVDPESLPAEAGLDAPPVTDTHKGCFLGQESVARVRNLGHPTRVVVALEADGDLRAGDPLSADGADVGVLTSVADGRDERPVALGRVRWEARSATLRTAAGVPLRAR